MNRSGMWNGCLQGLLLFTLVSALMLNAPSFLVEKVEAQTDNTVIKIIPLTKTVGQEGQPIPSEGLPLTVNITVVNVTDLYAWQIKVYYDPAILNFSEASYPTDHVFSGQDIVDIQARQETFSLALENTTTVFLNPFQTSSWKNGYSYTMSQWLDTDDSGSLTSSDVVWMKRPGISPVPYYVRTVGTQDSTVHLTVETAYVSYGGSLIGLVPGVDGNGTLCQLKFAGLNPGVSVLNFSRPLTEDNVLVDPDLSDISFSVEDSSVTVLGTVGKVSSTITVQASSPSVQVGSSVTISGKITPDREGAEVKIWSKPTNGTWTLLATRQTDANSEYTYAWSTSEVDTYDLKANWTGDSATEGAESPTITVEVLEEGEVPPPDYTLYLIVAAVVVIAIAAVGIYLLKIRKT